MAIPALLSDSRIPLRSLRGVAGVLPIAVARLMQLQQHGSVAERLPLQLFQTSKPPRRDDRIVFARADCSIPGPAVSHFICGVCQNRTIGRKFTVLTATYGRNNKRSYCDAACLPNRFFSAPL